MDLHPGDYVVTVDLGPNYEWVAEMQWPEGQTQGGPAVLVIRPSDSGGYPPGGLSQTVLREVDFKGALDKLRRRLENSKRWNRSRRRGEEKVTALLVEHAGGSLTPEYLALLSRVYIGAVNHGQAKPLDYLAEVTGNSPAAIKNHLWQATRKGLLERSPGRAGGRITETAAGILKPILGIDGLESLAETAAKHVVVEDDLLVATEPKSPKRSGRNAGASVAGAIKGSTSAMPAGRRQPKT